MPTIVNEEKEQFSFERLEVYQRAKGFVSTVYRLTRRFPNYEQFGMTAQFRRAAVSIPANIAEGAGRYSANERRQFYRTARASIFECVALLEVAVQEKYLEPSEWQEAYQECLRLSQMVSGLIRAL